MAPVASLAVLALSPLFAVVGVGARVFVQVNVGVEVRRRRGTVVRGDASLVHPHQLFRRDDAILDGLMDRRDCCFDESELSRRVLRADRRRDCED